MSVSNNSTIQATTNTGDGISLSPSFCAKVRSNDPSILPEPGEPFRIRDLSEREHMEVADALLENTCVTHLQLYTDHYTKRSAEAMAKYVRTNKNLKRIRWKGSMEGIVTQRTEEILC
jgi:hypothetical protein